AVPLVGLQTYDIGGGALGIPTPFDWVGVAAVGGFAGRPALRLLSRPPPPHQRRGGTAFGPPRPRGECPWRGGRLARGRVWCRLTVPAVFLALPGRPRDHRADLRDARVGSQCRGWPRGFARSRLCRVLCCRRLYFRSACQRSRLYLLAGATVFGPRRGELWRHSRLSGAAAAWRLCRDRHARLCGVRRHLSLASGPAPPR